MHSTRDAKTGTEVDLGQIFAAISDPTRRRILARLGEGPATVGELAEPFDISLPAISRHLKVLERAGLMRRRIDGRVHHCRAVPEPLLRAEAWIAERSAFWDDALDSLSDFLGEPADSRRRPEGPRGLASVRRDARGGWQIDRLLWTDIDDHPHPTRRPE